MSPAGDGTWQTGLFYFAPLKAWLPEPSTQNDGDGVDR